MILPIREDILVTQGAKIRNAHPADMNAMVDLLQELFTIESDFAVDRERQYRGLTMMLSGSREHRCVKVAEIKKNVVGMCTAQIQVSTAEGSKVALIEDMVVTFRYRGVGIGRCLMKSIEKWARDRSVTRLQLLADRTNFGALDFYDKIGWMPTQLICLRKKWTSN